MKELLKSVYIAKVIAQIKVAPFLIHSVEERKWRSIVDCYIHYRHSILLNRLCIDGFVYSANADADGGRSGRTDV